MVRYTNKKNGRQFRDSEIKRNLNKSSKDIGVDAYFDGLIRSGIKIKKKLKQIDKLIKPATVKITAPTITKPKKRAAERVKPKLTDEQKRIRRNEMAARRRREKARAELYRQLDEINDKKDGLGQQIFDRKAKNGVERINGGYKTKKNNKFENRGSGEAVASYSTDEVLEIFSQNSKGANWIYKYPSDAERIASNSSHELDWYEEVLLGRGE